MANLTTKQRFFVEHYLATLNATEAARRAGYKGDDNVLAVIGSKNIRKPKIRAEIDSRLAEAAMSADEVLYRLTLQAQSDFGEFLKLNEDGSWAFDFEKIKAHGHLVKKVGYSKDGVRVELHDAQSALALLGKYHKLFTDRIEHGGTVTQVQVTADELAAAKRKAQAFEQGLLSGEDDAA